MATIDNLWQRFKGNGKVYNYSSKWIWVVETTTNHPHGPAIAHKLAPNTKSPIKFDIDGFKRVDGKPIEGHKFWWKIWGHTTADIIDSGRSIEVDVIIKFKVPDDEFGSVIYKEDINWGQPIRNITKTKRGRSGNIESYYVEEYGWLSKRKAIQLVAKAMIDNAVIVQPKNRDPYLRARPDEYEKNNFATMEVG